jgi:hypothetical protein
MNKEINALYVVDTWDLMECPKGANVIGNKWVFRVKEKANGSVEKLKARLVALEYAQLNGVDFKETFSPVIKPVTIRILLSIALN